MAPIRCQWELFLRALTYEGMSTVRALSDAELIQRGARGCKRSFEQFYQRHADALYRYALVVSQQPSAAEEATQDVFVGVLSDAGGFDPQRSADARGWLYGLLRNALRRYLTRAGSEPATDAAAGSRSAEAAATWLEAEHGIGRAISALPLEQREVLVMCALQSMPYEVAAQVLDVPVGTVRSRLARARVLHALPASVSLPLGAG